MRLNVVACSIIRPWAAPLMTTSSAVGISSASSSLSPRGVRMSWLPTMTSVGTSIVAEQLGQRVVGGEDRLDLGGEGVRRAPEAERAEPADHRHEPAERSRPDHPAGGVAGHRADAVGRGRVGAQPVSSSLRHGWLRHAVHASVSERTRSGIQHGEDLGDRARPSTRRRRGRRSTPSVVEHGDRRRRPSARACRRRGLVAAAGAAVVEGDRCGIASEKTRRCRSQPCLSMPRPWIISTGGAEARPVTS